MYLYLCDSLPVRLSVSISSVVIMCTCLLVMWCVLLAYVYVCARGSLRMFVSVKLCVCNPMRVCLYIFVCLCTCAFVRLWASAGSFRLLESNEEKNKQKQTKMSFCTAARQMPISKVLPKKNQKKSTFCSLSPSPVKKKKSVLTQLTL